MRLSVVYPCYRSRAIPAENDPPHDKLPHIGTLSEKSLHAALKVWYAHSEDVLETQVDGYVIDIRRDDLLIEIQTGNFTSIKRKLTHLLKHYAVRLIYPVSREKWIVRLAADGETILSRRKSPRKGRVEDVFRELVRLPHVIANPAFSLEVLLVRAEQILIDDGQGSWRRKGWSIHDHRLLEVEQSMVFSSPDDLLALLPSELGEPFTNRELAKCAGLRPSIAQKMTYCLRQIGQLTVVGKKGQAHLYARQ